MVLAGIDNVLQLPEGIDSPNSERSRIFEFPLISAIVFLFFSNSSSETIMKE
jgi:hypothetical protein